MNAAAQGVGPQRERCGLESGVGAMAAGSFFRPCRGCLGRLGLQPTADAVGYPSSAPAGAAWVGWACNPRLTPWAIHLPPLPGLPSSVGSATHGWRRYRV
ncbi:MAG: hypothetical protein IIB58_01210 [Planctomycetes bacterium]|nr:hypothetical protein [Planctomycetota bacterium]